MVQYSRYLLNKVIKSPLFWIADFKGIVDLVEIKAYEYDVKPYENAKEIQIPFDSTS
nr:hypothetical protein [Mycoplasmopsis bovis]